MSEKIKKFFDGQRNISRREFLGETCSVLKNCLWVSVAGLFSCSIIDQRILGTQVSNEVNAKLDEPFSVEAELLSTTDSIKTPSEYLEKIDREKQVSQMREAIRGDLTSAYLDKYADRGVRDMLIMASTFLVGGTKLAWTAIKYFCDPDDTPFV
ncbi:MAG: hypothetical protein V1808_04115 [Candidatus Daviesbacteria bacterium]